MINGVINTSNREHRTQVFREPINILEFANLTTPPPRKNIGGKKNRKSKTKKNTKRITKRKILIKNKSKRNK